MITPDTALTTARETLATECATQGCYRVSERTRIINSHAELCSALDMLVRAAEHAAASTRPKPAPTSPTHASCGGKPAQGTRRDIRD